MTDWYVLSVVALLLLGTQRFFYKVAAANGYSAPLTTTVFMATVALLSGAVFFVSGATVDRPLTLLLLALLNSGSFAGATIANIEALKHLPAGTVFPLTRLSLVLVILASVLCFGERLAPQQWLGVLAGLSVVAVLGRDSARSGQAQPRLQPGLGFVALCVLCGALASISSKLAAEAVSKTGFMALSYLLGAGFALGIERRRGRRAPAGPVTPALLLGALMGGLNFLGYYAFLSALARGPLAAIALVTGMHFMIAILLSMVIYREKITPQRGLGIGLTVLAVLLLRQ